MQPQFYPFFNKLTPEQKNYVTLKLSSEKETFIAYICFFLLGAHYFYIGRPLTNILFYITFGGFGIWALIDLFRIPSMVNEYNTNYTFRVIEEAKLLYPSNPGFQGSYQNYQGY